MVGKGAVLRQEKLGHQSPFSEDQCLLPDSGKGVGVPIRCVLPDHDFMCPLLADPTAPLKGIGVTSPPATLPHHSLLRLPKGWVLTRPNFEPANRHQYGKVIHGTVPIASQKYPNRIHDYV